MKRAGGDTSPKGRSAEGTDWRPNRSALLIALALLAGCGSPVTPVTGCEAGSGLRPVCGFHNPEEIAHHHPTGDLLISEFGAMDGSAPGRLVAYRPGEAGPRALFPASDAVVEPVPGWGVPPAPGRPRCSRRKGSTWNSARTATGSCWW